MDSIIKSVNTRVVSTEPVIKAEEAASDAKTNETSESLLRREELEAEYDEKEKKLLQEYEEKMREAELYGEKIAEEARAEAERIKEEARAECERLKRDTLESAGIEGYEDGIRKAKAETEALISSAQADVDAILAEAYGEKEAILKSCESKILLLAVQIAEKILGIEIERNDKAFLSLVEKALLSAAGEKRVTLRVDPGEYDRFFKAKEAVFSTERGAVAAVVESDPVVGPGGLFIETESGDIDAGAETQISQIEKELIRTAGERNA